MRQTAIVLLALLPFSLPAAAQDDPQSLSKWLAQQIERHGAHLRTTLGREADRRMADMKTLRAMPPTRRALALRVLTIVKRTPPHLLDGTVLDTRTLQLTSLPAIMPELARARLVHVSESHDQAGHHQLQAQVVQGLAYYPGKTAVGMEMFHGGSKVALERYIGRTTTEQQFLVEVDWKKTWGFAWPLYAPILRAARQHRMPVVGLNIPRTLIRQVSRNGLAKLPDQLRKKLPEQIDLNHPAHRRRFFKMMGGHPGADQERLERYYQSMCVWDEAMAAAAVRFLKSNQTIRRMVVIAGTGHLAYRSGIPDRAAGRGGKPYVIVVPRTADSDRVDTARSDILRPPGRYVVFTR